MDLTSIQETVNQNINEDTWNIIVDYLSIYGLKILAALAIFVIGRWLVNWGTSILRKVLGKGNLDSTLVAFCGNIVATLGMAFVIIAALSQLGVETTSLAAVLAAAGLAIGLALQGSLSNFAAGFLIILFRPFKAGDYIEAAGEAGTVTEVSIFTTTLTTPDNRVVIVPNGNITSGSITNYSAKETRRIDLVVGVGYGDDLAKVKKTLTKILDADERILKDPTYTVAVSELADSSVNLVVRPWVNTADYWATRFDLTETIKKTFDKEGISIPFPQRDIHVIENAQAAKKAA